MALPDSAPKNNPGAARYHYKTHNNEKSWNSTRFRVLFQHKKEIPDLKLYQVWYLFWQNYYKLIQCTAGWWYAPPVFAPYLRDNRDRKDTALLIRCPWGCLDLCIVYWVSLFVQPQKKPARGEDHTNDECQSNEKYPIIVGKDKCVYALANPMYLGVHCC